MPLLIALALVAGIVLPVQVAANAQLRTGLGHPVLAAFGSFVVGSIGLALLTLAVRAPLPSGGALSRLAWWHWTGGLLGATYVGLTIILIPRLGAATLLGVVVAGQMLAALVMDHYGWLGVAHHPLNLWRAAGGLLVVLGVILIQRS